jgi:cell division protease FtsH
MDGFNQTDFVIVMGATNRPDVLDPALLRPGRFDRHVTVGKPTQKARVDIFKVHTRDVPLGDDVDLNVLASLTIGLTGADIRNIVNEAALWAARLDKNKVEMSDFEYARDKVLIGPKREEVLQAKEKEKTAYHEAGHTILAWVLPGAHRVHKVTIVPRGQTLGTTHMMPSEERMSMAESELRDQLVVLLAGRAAELLVYGEGTVGAQNDLERATSIARRMVTSWGMSNELGPVSFKLSDDDPFLGREMHQQRQFSEHTMERIDEEIGRILREAADRANKVLTDNRGKLEELSKKLIEKEELDDEDITLVLGPSIQTRSSTPDREPAEVPRTTP